MATVTRVPATSDFEFEDRVLRKTFRRLIVFLFLIYIFNYLDRINLGFAALSMNRELKLTATMFGLANTIFAAGYAVCEIPSNVLLARFGARKWIARILFTWGLASTATMFVIGPHSLYTIRLIEGIAEAGFVPGILLYLTFWFPPSFRARATALFLIAQPVTIIIGSSLSGVILDSHGILGLSGWRLLFFVEGFPAMILGIVTYFYLSDRPADCRWLNEKEKAALEGRLQREQTVPSTHASYRKAWREIFTRNALLLSLAYFGIVAALNTTAYWTPQILREVAKHRSFSYVGLLTAIPAVLTAIAMPIWGSRSDRKMERTWHLIGPLLLAATGWAVVAFVSMPESRLLGLICASVGGFVAMTIFWTIPPHVLSPGARPVGIAFISTAGMIGGLVAPFVVGFLKDLTHTFTASLLFIVVVLVIAAAAVFLVPAAERKRVAVMAGVAESAD